MDFYFNYLLCFVNFFRPNLLQIGHFKSIDIF